MIRVRGIVLQLFIVFLSGCAVLHRVQLGEFDQSPQYVPKPFEIRVTEFGLDAAKLSNDLSYARSESEGKNLAGLIALFQIGPRTGNPVYNRGFGANLFELIYEKCPSGRVSGLMTLRENREFRSISGEYVVVKGYCLLPKENP